MPGQDHQSVGAWAKRCYFASRAAMEHALRPHGLGAAQWYVLYHLAHDGPTMQRDLLQILQVERPTLSGIVAALVARGLVEQAADTVDQRQKSLRLSDAGTRLWQDLPDLTFIRDAAFGGMEAADIDTAIRVLRTATERLDDLVRRERTT